MANTFHLQIVTPEGSIFDGQVESVLLPGSEGEMEALPSHAKLMTQVQPGELRIKAEGKTTELAIGEGFAEVSQNQVIVLTDLAVKADEIDEKKTQEAIERAQNALRSQTLVGEELEATQALLARSLVQSNLRKKKSGGHA
jgi:F-type H+-transporting ATPase subunit epsilon